MPDQLERSRETEPTAAWAGQPQLIHELEGCVRDADGTTYLARVYGRPRVDGTWAGWIEFVATGAPTVLRTGRETTQSSRAQVAYWAFGLEPVYLEGAFQRTRRPSPVTNR